MLVCISAFVSICRGGNSVLRALEREEQRNRQTDIDRWGREGWEILSVSRPFAWEHHCVYGCVCINDLPTCVCVCVVPLPACGCRWSPMPWQQQQQRYSMHDTDSRIYARHKTADGDRGSLRRPSCPPPPPPPPTPCCDCLSLSLSAPPHPPPLNPLLTNCVYLLSLCHTLTTIQ